jgi:hypothetical protein
MSKMNPRIKRLWVKALRSRKYKRATKHLKTDTGYCCLGVLCDLYINSKEGKENNAKWSSNGGILIEGFTEGKVLPSKVQKWAGLNSSNPAINDSCLAQLNDIGCNRNRKGFSWIADIIEKNL